MSAPSLLPMLRRAAPPLSKQLFRTCPYPHTRAQSQCLRILFDSRVKGIPLSVKSVLWPRTAAIGVSLQPSASSAQRPSRDSTYSTNARHVNDTEIVAQGLSNPPISSSTSTEELLTDTASEARSSATQKNAVEPPPSSNQPYSFQGVDRWGFPHLSERIVGKWLFFSAASVFGIIVFGALTRLTESG